MSAEPAADLSDRRSPAQWAAHINALGRTDLAAALEACEAAKHDHPGRAFAHSLAGNLLTHLGRQSEAERELLAAVRLEPGDWKTLSRLARLRAHQGRHLSAVRLYRTVVAARSCPSSAMDEFVTMLMQDGDFRLSARIAAQALAKDPTPRRARTPGFALAMLAQDAQAGVSSVDKSAWGKAIEQLLAGRPEAARLRLGRLTARSPGYAGAWTALSGASMAAGKPQQAQDTLRRWRTAQSGAAPLVDAVEARAVSPRGLLFDPRTPLELRPLREHLACVDDAEALLATPDSFVELEPGGERLRFDPMVRAGDTSVEPFVGEYVTIPQFLARIDHALLVGRGAVVGRQGALVAESHSLHPARKYRAERSGATWRFDPRTFNDGRCEVRFNDRPAIVFCGVSDTSFGDWIANFGPRLWLVRGLGPDVDVVVRDGIHPQFIDMLQALGVGRERIRFHHPQGASLFPALYLPSWPGGNNTPMRSSYQVYEPLKRARSAWDGKRLYLSRQGVSDRPLANEAEVAALFASKGFEIVRPETLSFAEALEVFAAPSCVAGPYGSAFHNLAFTRNRPLCLALAGPHTRKLGNEIAGWFGLLGKPLAMVDGVFVDTGAPSARGLAWTMPLQQLEPAIDAALAMTTPEGFSPR